MAFFGFGNAMQGTRALRNFMVIVCLVALLPSSLNAQEHLSINTGHNPPLATDDNDGFHDLVAIEAYRRAGITIEIHRLPSARSSVNANTGIDDGNGPRIDGYDKFFPNLRQIPEKIIDFEFVGFTKKNIPEVKNWDSLKPYNVGIITGWKILETNIRDVRSLTKAKNTEQLFQLLANDRVDVVFLERWQGLFTIRALGLEDIRVMEPPFATRPMFFYLNKKYEHLIPRVTDALREMKQDGTYDALYKEHLDPLLGG